jgi:hypothetical protein
VLVPSWFLAVSLIVYLGVLALLMDAVAGIRFWSKGKGRARARAPHSEIRLAVVAASLAVPLVGMLFGGPGGFFVVLLFGGPVLLVYLLSVRSALGSVISGLALLGLAIGSEVYAIGRAGSSTVGLAYLLILLGGIPVLAATSMAEALTQPLAQGREKGGRRRMSPTVRSLVSAELLVIIWSYLMRPWAGGWGLASIGLVILGAAAIAVRLFLERRVPAR